jgi:acyl-coenzyme A thioesterase PaaI-like protein
LSSSTSNEIDDTQPRLNVRNDHYCFGCGHLNPWGLKLSFYENPDGVSIWAPWTPRREHEGYGGIAHGGIISTVLDEVMAWSGYLRQIWAVTAKINVNFRKPVEIGVPTRAIGRIVAARGRVVYFAGEIRREHDDVLLADATGLFVRVPEEKAREWRERYSVAPQ